MYRLRDGEFLNDSLVAFYLSYLHIERQLADYGGYDIGITTHLMLQVLKLQALGYNYKDGNTDPERLTAYQKDKRVVVVPSILEMYSYTFFC